MVKDYSQLMQSVMDETGMSKAQTEKAMLAVKKAIINTLKSGDDVRIAGLMRFRHCLAKGRDYTINGKTVHKPSHKIIRAKVSTSLYEG